MQIMILNHELSKNKTNQGKTSDLTSKYLIDNTATCFETSLKGLKMKGETTQI